MEPVQVMASVTVASDLSKLLMTLYLRVPTHLQNVGDAGIALWGPPESKTTHHRDMSHCCGLSLCRRRTEVHEALGTLWDNGQLGACYPTRGGQREDHQKPQVKLSYIVSLG